MFFDALFYVNTSFTKLTNELRGIKCDLWREHACSLHSAMREKLYAYRSGNAGHLRGGLPSPGGHIWMSGAVDPFGDTPFAHAFDFDVKQERPVSLIAFATV